MTRKTPEGRFKTALHEELREMFPGCVLLINDASYFQGVPDTLILFEDMWAMLEVKDSRRAKRQPNQPYWVEQFNEMSFAAFICPENKEEVLNALQHSFRRRRPSRISQR